MPPAMFEVVILPKYALLITRLHGEPARRRGRACPDHPRLFSDRQGGHDEKRCAVRMGAAVHDPRNLFLNFRNIA
jgi:hypothetical protein